MLLLPATCPPTRKQRAAFTKFVGCVRRARATEIMYLPRWCASTLLERAPEVEAVPDDMDVLIYDLYQDEINTRNQVRLLESVLAMNWDQPFDATCLKGLQASYV